MNEEITLEEFLSKSYNTLDNRKEVEYLPVKGFGKLPFSRPTDNQLLKYLSEASRR